MWFFQVPYNGCWMNENLTSLLYIQVPKRHGDQQSNDDEFKAVQDKPQHILAGSLNQTRNPSIRSSVLSRS